MIRYAKKKKKKTKLSYNSAPYVTVKNPFPTR